MRALVYRRGAPILAPDEGGTMRDSIRRLLAASFVASFASVGCGGDLSVDTADDVIQTSALTAAAPKGYLVSFTSGGIPANAAALIAAAGGSLAARYDAVGVVLAKSSNSSFAATLRGASGVDAVGAVSAVHSGLGPVGAAGPRHPHSSRPAAGSDPLSFRQWDMDQIHAPQARAVA